MERHSPWICQSVDKVMGMASISYVKGQLTKEDAHNHHLGVHEWTDKEFSKGQLMAVTGRVWFVADDRAVSLPRMDPPVLCVSIPGINLAYSQADKDAFGQRLPSGRYTVNQAGHIRLRLIWHHTLYMFAQYNVQCPVLCAIGCGAVATFTEGVPAAYSNALVDVLDDFRDAFYCVFFSLVNPEHFQVFRDVFKKEWQRCT